MEKESKIFVAGHRGFVGSNLIDKLKALGYTNVHGYSRSQLDLSDGKKVLDKLQNESFDYVFICAAKCGGVQANIDDPYTFLFDNLAIQNSVINACIKSRVKKVLFLGSSCIYPANYKQPLKEEYILNAPVETTNEGYSIAKIAGLKLCEYANRMYGKKMRGVEYSTRFVSLMPCNLYGPGDDFDLRNSHVMAALIRRFIEAKNRGDSSISLWGSGKARREFLYIEDLAECMIWSMNNIPYTETFLNVGSGEDISISDLASKINVLTGGNQLELVFDTTKPEGMLLKCLDISRMKDVGWQSKTTLDEGIKKTIEYFRGVGV
tara:strand:+ start:530 stop:1492 length:963 start_codon:yes stop_codon:yes gene_type:complete